MVFSSLKLARSRRGDTSDRLREARDRPKRDGSSVDQLASERIKLSGLRLLSEDGKALDRKCEQPPRTSDVFLSADWKPSALFIKDCQRASAISLISHLSKKRSLAESID